jgi:hypothetical protein
MAPQIFKTSSSILASQHSIILALGLAAVASGLVDAPFQRSRALGGSIQGVDRARVVDLVNPDPDRALAPHWRASLLK